MGFGLRPLSVLVVYMAEELTTDMHGDFLDDYIPRKDLYVLSVVGAMNRGVSKDVACRIHGISVEYFDKNRERVLSTDYDLP